MYRNRVAALIINKQNEFLLINLNSFEDWFFAIPGGGIEEGETAEDAVYREIREELGIEKTCLEYIGKSDAPLRYTFKIPRIRDDGRQYEGSDSVFFGFAFVGNDGDIKLQADEVKAYKWVPYADLGKYLLFDNQLGGTDGKIREIFPAIADPTAFPSSRD